MLNKGSNYSLRMITKRINPNLLLITFAILITTTLFFLSSAILRSANTFGRQCLPELDEYPDDTLKSNLKIAIVSFSDEEKASHGRSFQGLMELVGVNKRNYAQKMGYDFVDGKWLVDSSRPPSWSKILAIDFHLDSYDWVFWNDADTVVTNPDISLESILRAAIGHLDFHASPNLLVTEDIGGVNAGVFFIRRSKWSKEFLVKWWNETSFIKFGSTKSGDNAAMKHLIDNLSLEDVQSHVMISPMQCLFNSYPWNPTWKSLYRLMSSPQTIWKGAYSRGDFMVHFAGLDNKREWAAKVLKGISRFLMESIESNAANEARQTLSTQSQTELQHKSSSRQSKSLVWDHMTKITRKKDNGEMETIALCKHCKMECPASAKQGTSGLRYHLFYICSESPLYVKKGVDKDQSQEGLGGSLVPHSFNQNRCMIALAKFIVKNEVSFRMVESDGFRELLAELQPRFIVPDRKKIASSIWDLFTIEKTKLKSVIGDRRVNITTDTWTSVQNINYMVITAHFMDSEWKLHKRIIAFTKINSHKGDDIGRVLENCLNEWGIDKIFTITVDNASANDTAIGYIKRRLEYSNSLLLNGKYLHLRCVCHILNLIVKDGLKFYNEAVEGIRNLVKYIHSSPSRLDRFRYYSNLIKKDKMAIVPLDCPTRWNATFKMLDIAYKFRKVFERMCVEDAPIQAYFNEMVKDKKKNLVKRTGPPKEDDWEKSRVLVEFLKGFHETTLKLSATKSVTSSLIFDEIILVQDAIEQANNNIEDSNLHNVGKLMKAKYDKYWGNIEVVNKVIFIAHVLDPRYKFQSLQISFLDIGWDDVKINGFLNDIKYALNELYDDYRKSMNIPTTSGSNVVVRIEEVDEQFDGNLRSKKLKRLQQTRKEEQSLEITNEVDRYLNDPFENLMSREFHLLSWWNGNQTKYPILSKIAKDVLAIPSSTVASESAFSLGRRVVDPFRASLAPKMVEALVCLSDWLRSENLNCHQTQIEEDVELFMDTEALCEGKKLSLAPIYK